MPSEFWPLAFASLEDKPGSVFVEVVPMKTDDAASTVLDLLHRLQDS